ncbi:choice-of-anchor Q domain-containing protein [Herpetosiphon llansteffanensis]|uniref:choice-of-anchor Q domain-containing protein n=1 Tax=Herpetosiphon llansteffanensis TaxID=2094568 RepID=UPI000D7BBCD7|nr:choice-of-anchor Q domain-containing protein [Herpetosiphon llansteffanensis]
MHFLRWIGIGSLGLAISWQAAAASINQPQALHTTITVNTFVDDLTPNNGTCSLREAIQAANTNLAVDACPAGSASDTIQLAAGSYTLSLTGAESPQTGDLDLNGTIQLTGVTSATSIINANGIDRALEITGGNVSLRNLQVREGFLGGSVEESMVYGQGILHRAGSLTIDNSTLTTNGMSPNRNSLASDMSGGGIASLSGYLTITNSLIEKNYGPYVYMESGGIGAGLYIDESTVSITNSRFSQSTGGAGSAIYNDAGHLTLNNSTIDRHTGINDYAAALVTNSGQTVVNASIFSLNKPGAMWVGRGSATVKNSLFNGNGGNGSFYCSNGGAISSSGTLTVSNSRFINNWANNAGAIGVVTGTATIDHSEFSGNSTYRTTTGRAECLGDGGAMSTGNGGKVRLDSSTIAYNRADGFAAGIVHSNNPNPLIITNSTIVSNTNTLLTPDSGSIVENDGPGITALYSSTVQLSNTIVAGNRNSASNVARDCSGLFSSQGHVLIEHADAVCNLTQATGDLIGVQPLLGSFDFHGGATRSFSLDPASPAVDAGPSTCGATDQRYFPRPVDGDDDDQARCDIGAFEFGSAAIQYTFYIPMTIK